MQSKSTPPATPPSAPLKIAPATLPSAPIDLAPAVEPAVPSVPAALACEAAMAVDEPGVALAEGQSLPEPLVGPAAPEPPEDSNP